MNQIIHIFRKDVRHFWIEILLTLALLAYYCRVQVRAWQFGSHATDIGVGALYIVPAIGEASIGFVLVLAWCMLIIRVIHDESLVGDKQFWVTRPYEWPKLLGSKLLFIAVYFNAALLISQMLLLRIAGYNPFAYFSGLLQFHAQFAIVLLLPTIFLACVTRNLVQPLLAVIGFVLIAFTLSALSRENEESYPGFLNSTSNTVFWTIVAAATVIAIVYQFARRRRWQSSSIAVGAFLLVFTTSNFVPHPDMQRAYPRPSQPLPIAMSLMPAERKNEVQMPPDSKARFLRFRVRLDDDLKDRFVDIEAMQWKIVGANGEAWQSKWHVDYRLLRPGTQYIDGFIKVPVEFLRKIGESDARVAVTMATRVYQQADETRVVAQQAFYLPDGGRCFLPNAFSYYTIPCIAPLRVPSLLVKIVPKESTCVPDARFPAYSADDARSDVPVYSLTARTLERGLDTGISPVRSFMLSGSGSYFAESDAQKLRAPICAGTPLSISHLEPLNRFMIEASFDKVKLSEHEYPSAVVGPVQRR